MILQQLLMHVCRFQLSLDIHLATDNIVINCKNGVVKLSFGNLTNGVVKLSFRNMTLELNIFNVRKQLSFDTYEVRIINFIEEVCKEDDIILLCISNLL